MNKSRKNNLHSLSFRCKHQRHWKQIQKWNLQKILTDTLVLAVVFYGFIVSCDLLLIYFHKWMDSSRNVHNFSFCIRKLWPGSESFKDYQSQYGVFSDTDECVTEKQNCSANAVCSNVNGSYKRECKTGYFGDGWTCEGNAVKHCELN